MRPQRKKPSTPRAKWKFLVSGFLRSGKTPRGVSSTPSRPHSRASPHTLYTTIFVISPRHVQPVVLPRPRDICDRLRTLVATPPFRFLIKSFIPSFTENAFFLELQPFRGFYGGTDTICFRPQERDHFGLVTPRSHRRFARKPSERCFDCGAWETRPDC